MQDRETKSVADTLAEMRSAVTDLAKGSVFLNTTEAVQACPFEICTESLLAYPPYILPRFAMKPKARRKTYLWDPRDLRDLPVVLRRWEAAIAAGPEELQTFRDERARELAARNVVHLRVA